MELLECCINRQQFIETLAETRYTQAELVAETDASQPTVSRAVSELQSLGLVRRDNNEYELTQLGNLLRSTYHSTVSEVTKIREASQIIAAIPAGFPEELFLNSDIVTSSTAQAPDNAIAPIMEYTASATNVRACASVVWTTLSRQISDRIVTHGLEAEIILTKDLTDEPIFLNQTAALKTGRLNLYAKAGEFPYDLSIIETPEKTYVALMVRTEPNRWSTVVSTNERALMWAENQFQRFKEMAEPWTPHDVNSPTP